MTIITHHTVRSSCTNSIIVQRLLFRAPEALVSAEVFPEDLPQSFEHIQIANKAIRIGHKFKNLDRPILCIKIFKILNWK